MLSTLATAVRPRPTQAWLAVAAMALGGCSSVTPALDAELRAPEAHEHSLFVLKPGLPVATRPTAAAAAAARVDPPPPAGQLADGQLLVSTEVDDITLFVGLFPQAFQRWTHIGVVAIEPDGAWVYDMNNIVREALGPPSAEISGTVGYKPDQDARRIAYAEYVTQPGRVFGLYAPPPGVDGARLVAYAREQFLQRTPFDKRFDADDAAALYCSEMVARGVELAGGAPVSRTPVRRNRSYDRLREWRGIPATGYYAPGNLLSPERERARWSARWSAAQIEAFFVAREALAARVTENTRLGELMQLNSPLHKEPLRLREGPRAFIEASLALAVQDASGGPDPAALRARVAALAQQFFVPVPPGP